MQMSQAPMEVEQSKPFANSESFLEKLMIPVSSIVRMKYFIKNLNISTF